MSDVEAENSILARPYIRYLFAVAAVVVAFFLRDAAVRYVGAEVPPFIFFYPTVMTVALLSGLWPGVLATTLAALISDYWILPPRGSLTIANAADGLALALFFGMGIFMSLVAQRYRRYQRRVEAFKREQAQLRSDEKLLQSEKQYETLANAIPQLCWIANPDGWIFWYNERWYSYTGTTPEQMKGWGWQSVHDPEALPKVLEQWKASIATGEPFDMVFPLLGADGEFRPFLTRVMPVKDTAGKIVRWFGTNTDISEQKRVEEELRNSRERLRLFINHAPAALAMFDREMRYLHASQRWLTNYGLGDRDLRGLPHYEIFPEISEQWKEFHRRGMAGEVLREEADQFVRADGSVQWIRWEIRPWYDARGVVGGIVIFSEDITERKQAEQRIAHLASFPEVNDNPILESDLKGKITYANPAAQRQSPTPWEAGNGHPLLKDWSPIAAGLKTGVERSIVREVQSDGRVFLQRIHYLPALGVVRSYFADITERKQAEDALRESEERLRLFIDYAPAELAMFDREMRYLYASHRWLAGHGLGDRVPLGQSHYDVFPEAPERWKQNHQRGMAGEVLCEEADRFVRADGSVQWKRWEIRPWRNARGEVGGIVIFDENITDRKQSEAALRKSEERWSTTLQSIGDAVISTDATGNIEFMNEVAQRLTGWALPEARGLELTAVFNIVQEETRIKPEDPVAKVLRLGKVVGLANHTALISRNGMELPIEDSAAPIRGREGQIEGVVLVFHDVAEQRRSEKALRISDRLATTGRLAATIAHEIHNPLDAVSNLLYLIGQDQQSESTREYVSMASRELVRITQMTQRMLAFQREAMKPVPVKIKEILDNVTELYERKIKAAEIDLKQEVDFDGHILAMPGELRQVFANLVGNAIEAVGSRRGTIILRAYATQDWRSRRPGLRVVVADDGPGIPADVRHKIFEPFFTTKGESGTGLGLWITSDIIRKYDGTMRLRTSTQSPLSGTCFSVFLPFDGRAE